MAVVFKNNAKTTLASGITSSATSITVADGSVFPTLTGSDTFFCTLDDGTNIEIVEVTAISSNTLTVTRAQDNTSATSFSTGTVAELRLTAGILNLFSQTGSDINAEVEAYLDANGLTLPDNVKAQFGASNDLQIYHSGTNSIISEQGTGVLEVRTNGTEIQLTGNSGTDYMARFVSNGKTQLHYDGSAKLDTTSTGITVTGAIAETTLGTILDTSGNLTNINNVYASGYRIGSTTVIDSSRNLTNIGTISSGAITVTSTVAGTTASTFSGNYSASGDVKLAVFERSGGAVASAIEYNDATTDMEFGTTTSHSFSLKTADTRRLTIDSSGNSTFTGTISSGAITSTGQFSVNTGATGTLAQFRGADTDLLNIDGDSNAITLDARNVGAFNIEMQGTNALTIDNSQNATFAGGIEIGTSASYTPVSALAINEAVNTPAIEIIPTTDENSSNTASIRLWGTRFGTANRYSEIKNITDGSTANNELVFDTNGSEALRLDSSQNATFAGSISSGAITTSGDIDLTGTSDTSSEKIILPRSGHIGFYGNTDLSHAISSMGTDDIRINSYAEIILNLDSNENNTQDANFRIIKHGGGSSAGTSVFTIDGETGDATFTGAITASGDAKIGNTVTNPASGFSNQKGFGYATSTGQVQIATTANTEVLQLGKNNTNDGNILTFRKESTIVGSIGVYNSATAILSGSAASYSGLYLNTNRIEPVGNSFGTEIRADNTINIGSPTYRFKDLYLSGTGTFDTQVLLPSQGTANSTTTAYESAALVLQGSGWDTNGSVARAGSWTIKNVPTASVYPEFDLNFYETGDELRFQLHGRGTTGYVDPSAATFHGNVNINADSSGSSGAGAGDLTVAGAINMGTDSGDPFNSQSVIKIQDGGNAYIQIKAGTSAAGGLLIGDTGDDFVGGFLYSNSNDTLSLYSGNAVAVSFNSSQNAVFAGTISSSDITSSGNLHTSGYVTIDSTTDGKLKLKVASGESNDWNYIEFYGADDTRDGYVGTDADGDMKFFSDKNSSELRLESTGATISTNLTVTGDLTVNGTTTTVNQTNLDVSDNLIGLNRGASSNANDSGILIERGSTGDNVFIGYDESTDKITFATTTNVPSDTGNLTLTAAPIQASSIGVTNIVTNKVVKYNGSILDDSMITDNGTSVGIDQPSPSSTYKLDVSGAVRSSTTSPSFTLQETDSSNQTWALGSYAGTAAIRDITGGTYPLQILTGSPTNSVRIESTKVVISSALESSGTISYNPDVGGDLTLGNDGSYGTHTNGRYLTLGFGGTTNGYNRIFAGNTADAPLFINSATGRGIYFRTNGGSADSVIIDTTAGIRSRGQVRATGWYGSQSSDNNGLAAEIGVSGSNAYLLSYNRSSSAYGALRLEGAGITFDPRGSTFTITNSSYVQSDSDIRAASSRVRIGNPTGLPGRSGIRIDTTGDAAADLVFGDNTGSTSWSNANWALSSRSTSDNQVFRIYRGTGQPSPYNSEAVAVEIARDLNMTLGKGLVLGSSSTLSIPAHSGTEIDITGSTAGNIRANSDLYILSQNGSLRLGAGGTNSQISLATNGNATFVGNVALTKANPVLILNDTTASSNADQVAYISFQDNGSEEAWVGWGSSGNTDLTIKNNIGSVVLDGTGTTVINDNLDLNGNADISGTLTAAGDITAGSGTLTVQATGYGGGQIGLGDWTNTNPIGISEGLWNSVTSDNDYLTVYARQHFNVRGYSGGTLHWLTLDSSVLNLQQSQALQLNGTTVIDSSANITSNSLVRSNSRIASSHKYSPGHYSKGDQVFAIDPTWSESELQSFFNSTSVTWSAQSDAPGGYAVYINGSTSVGGVYGSGFGHIPIETGDLFYMECWIKNVGENGHYMGSNEFNENFGNVGGNPGSFGYWTMSNTNPGTSWVKVSGYISNVSGTGTTTGQFDIGAKYWTPMALFNYTNSSGTRACYISGWKVYRVNRGSPLWIVQSSSQPVTAADTVSSYSGSVGSGWTPMALVDNNTKPGHPLVIKNSRSDYWSMGIDTHSYGIYARAYSADTRSILQGTDTAGNVVFDAGFDGDLAIGGDISMAGLYAGTWGPSSSSSVGRIGQVTDRVAGSITNQIGGSTSAKWEIVNYQWSAVLLECDNNGNTYIGGSLGIGVSPDTSHSLKISSNDNEPLEILSSAGGCWINVQGSGSQVMSMGVDTNGWAIYDRTNSAYRIRVANNGQLQTLQGIANSSSYSQTGGSFSTAGATEVRLTDGTERVRIQGYDLLGYGAGGNGLWVISNVTANASNQTTLTLGTEWDWDDSISFKYVPAASGSAGGVLTIGQAQKNSTSWNHNTTNFSFNGSTIFQFANTSRLEMRPTSSSGGERVYYAAGSYTANTSATFQDVRMVGTQPVDHKYVRDSSGNYGYKQENWWDGNSYQSIRQQNDAFRFSVDVIAFDTSDKRLKNNITPIENCLDKVSKLGAYEFEWDETKQRRFKGFDTGVIAQEVEEIYPHMIETREDGYKALQYEKLVPLLLGAIKEQQEQIESLKSEVDNLKGEK